MSKRKYGKIALAVALVLGVLCLGAIALAEEVNGGAAPTISIALGDETDANPSSGEEGGGMPAPVEPAEAPAPAPQADPKEAPAPEPKVFKVTFMDAQGEVLRVIRVEEGQLIKRIRQIPVLEGYTFSHWYDEAIGTEKFVFGNPATKNLILKPYMAKELAGAPEDGGDAELEETDPDPVEDDLDLEDDGLDEADPDQLTDELLPEDGEQEAPPTEIVNRGAQIATSVRAGSQVKVGDTITMTAVLTGYEGATVDLVWQYNDGSGWRDAQSGGRTLYFTLNEANYRWEWRLAVTVLAEPTIADQA